MNNRRYWSKNRFKDLVYPALRKESMYGADEKEIAKIGWDKCKKEVLRILKRDIQNCDLSYESCDKRYMEKIEEL